MPAQRCQGHHMSCTVHWSCDKGSHRPVVRRYASSRWPNRPVHTGCEPPAARSRTSAYAPAAGHTSREGKGIRGAGTTGPSDPRSARPLAALRDSGGRHSRQPLGLATLARILKEPPRAPPGLATSMPPPSWWTGTPPSRGRDGDDGATTGGTGDEPANHRRPHRRDGGSGAAGTRVDRAGAPQVVEGCPAPIPTGDRPPASRWRPVRRFPATSSSPSRKGVPAGPRSSVRGTRTLGDDPMERSPAAMVARRIIPPAPARAVPSSAIALGSRPDSSSDALARGRIPIIQMTAGAHLPAHPDRRNISDNIFAKGTHHGASDILAQPLRDRGGLPASAAGARSPRDARVAQPHREVEGDPTVRGAGPGRAVRVRHGGALRRRRRDQVKRRDGRFVVRIANHCDPGELDVVVTRARC